MEQPQGDQSRNDHSSGDLPIVPAGGSLHPDHKQKTNPSDAAENEGGAAKGYAKESYWKKLTEEGPDRHIELLLALVIALFAAGQLITSCYNNSSTSKQTADIITGINNAVVKLHDQATTTQNQLEAFKKSTGEVALTQATINLPLVIPAGVSISAETENGQTVYKITQKWSNVGQTRAVAPQIKWGWGKTRPNSSTRYEYIPKIWLHSTVIPVTPPIFDTRVLTKREVEILKAFNPGDPLFVYGRIKYFDIFPTQLIQGGRRNDHLIEYSIQIVKVSITDKTADWGGKEIPYGYCYDEKCKDY